ncbi:hypothetical protein [Maridesulfovibrio sp.]|uniref:hypothetical protein n=1 Tax=Maridesulfovibrio sp. TaxID=2795000 RepID=UPI0029F551F5|nr:hypothetical protein [Maridesulfovibrio sp.]
MRSHFVSGSFSGKYVYFIVGEGYIYINVSNRLPVIDWALDVSKKGRFNALVKDVGGNVFQSSDLFMYSCCCDKVDLMPSVSHSRIMSGVAKRLSMLCAQKMNSLGNEYCIDSPFEAHRLSYIKEDREWLYPYAESIFDDFCAYLHRRKCDEEESVSSC